ncbi:hypothetical protein SH528x_002173 [Novipirellula sp. SH528]|uniref:hypothetical protein n=1 Tax=Novipirellula sp. SH528 TaxID=3454466 RepID=UPI003FA04C10
MRELDLQLNSSLAARLKNGTLETYVVNDDSSSDVSTQLSLHAKLFLLERGQERSMLIGSANASHSAWEGPNCEAMMSFDPSIKASQFVQQFVLQDDKCRPWIEQYTFDDWENREDETDEEKIGNLIGAIQKLLKSLRFSLSFDDKKNTLSLASECQGIRAELEQYRGDGFHITATPISLMDDSGGVSRSDRLIDQAFAGGISYEVTVSKLTEFVGFSIHHEPTAISCQLVLKASSHDFANLLESRDQALLKEELSARQFAKFLTALLFDDAAASRKDIRRILTGRTGGGNGRDLMASDVFIEDVMRSCTEDASRIGEITRMLETFDGKDGEGEQYVGDDFRAFWLSFKESFIKVHGA